MNTMVCPKCKKEFEITEAISHKMREDVLAKANIDHKEELAKIKAETEKRLKEESLKGLQRANEEKEKLEEKLLKGEKERKEFEKKVRDEALKKAEDEQRFKLKEKDLHIEELRKVNEDFKRKLEQGSQQRQGEAMELELEESLKLKFPNDEFVPIPKGIEGGDIWQKVIYQGRIVGSILWETKRTKAWQNIWISKLKNDASKIKSSEAIIVSQAVPSEITNFDRKEGVWITKYEHAISVCRYVRYLITNLTVIKSSSSHTREDWGKIRDYFMGDTFKYIMQAHFDGVKTLREILDAEKKSSLLKWKRQEDQIEKLDSNNINFYGDLKGIVGNSLPQIKGIDTTELGLQAENKT
ncbi:MAG: hypothetical protein A3C22_01325 [Candidatus Levybacteria bacterium RIFCSPHIGHO2_02_FULL_37_10]|nr:MAG: hypothetical protein A3C22_01325 [Candidatus Levybacteria bacterium RIFCSPHIGHO2_02_FULL_37_10]OGH42255.1 MAG: hypothetical protein A3H79_01605 [Candidatus Levybacteria bacterium RIFCSPLOWO2_02_FULL_36_8b]